MAKTEEQIKETKNKSPVIVAKEAIDAGKSLDSALPPSISLDGMGAGDIAKAVQSTIVEQVFSTIQQNTLDAALASSERYRDNERRKLEEGKRVVPQPAPQPQISPGGLLASLPGAGDRAAMLKATLDSFESDEARARFIDTHPELFSASPFPQQFQNSPRPSMFPAQQPPQADPTDVMQRATSMVMEQMARGMEIQRAMSPSQSVQSQSLPDVTQIATTFKEINDKNTAAFSELIKGMQEQNRAAQEALTKANQEQQSKIIEMQMTSLERERQLEREFTTKRMEQLEAALASPPPVSMADFRLLMEQGKANGVPVSMETPEQARVNAEIQREDLKLQHSLQMESKRLDLETLKESRRNAAFNTVTAGLGSVLETQLLKKHVPTQAGNSVASRF